MRTVLTLSLLSASFFLHAQDLDRVLPAPVPNLVESIEDVTEPERSTQKQLDEMGLKLWATPDEDILLPELKGVRVVGAAADVDASQVNADNPLISEVGDLDLQEAILLLLSGYTEKPASEESIERMVSALRLLLAQVGYPFSLVFLPPQDVTEGFLHLVVVESRIGTISVEGNRYFSEKSFLSRIPLRSGDAVNVDQLNMGIERIKSNSFREATARFKKGTEPATVDLVLQTRDRRPLRIFTGYNNTGSKATTEGRHVAGLNWGNALGLGHQATLQWTSDIEAKYSRALSGNYTADLPRNHSLTFLGAYSKIEGKTEVDFDQRGESWQAGLNYDVPLSLSNAKITKRLQIGVDFKSSDNNLDFLAPPFIIQVVDNLTHVVQARAMYRLTIPDRFGVTDLGFRITVSPGGLSSSNQDEDFQAARAFAKAAYIYGNLDVTRNTRLPSGWTWLLRGQVQQSSANLLGSEAFSGGGSSTVRGYAESEVLGDNAILLSQELHLPPSSPGARVGIPDSLDLFLFTDYAAMHSVKKLPDETDTDLLSVGLGLNYELNRHGTLSFSYGWQLKKLNKESSSKDGRAHITMMLQY